jgi:hypothetical protein
MTDQDSNANSSLADALETSASPADTSPAQNSAETQASAPDPGDNTASPPNAPADDRAGLLEAVRNVVEVNPKSPEGEGTTAAPETTGSETDAQPSTDALDADPTDEEIQALRPRTKARIEKLLAQRNDARSEADALKPDVAKWQQMDGYLKRHDLAPEDVNLLLGVGAALRRGDFQAFRDGVMPYLELCNQHLGLSLPPDLQDQVDTGEISQDAAKELSVARLTNARLQGQQQARTQAAQAAEQEAQQVRTAQVVTNAVMSWEADVKARDPDYAKKAQAVLRVSQALIAEHGRPTTAEAAVALANHAYEEATRMFAAAMPAPVPTRPQPSGARAVSSARAEPTTLMEAALLGLERARAS